MKSFVHPEQLFWSAQQLGRFAFTIPPNLNSYRPLFDVLGVTDGPEGADYVRIIHEISDEYFVQSKALQGQDRAVFDLCLEVACDPLRPRRARRRRRARAARSGHGRERERPPCRS